MKYTTQQLKDIMIGNFREEGWLAKASAVMRRFSESNVFNSINTGQEDYRSYFELFCHKKDQDPDSPSIRVFNNGISVLLSKYVPAAVYGANHYTSTSHTIMPSSSAYTLPTGSWEKEIKEIQDILTEFSVPLLPKEFLIQKMPFEPPESLSLNIDNYDKFYVFLIWFD